MVITATLFSNLSSPLVMGNHEIAGQRQIAERRGCDGHKTDSEKVFIIYLLSVMEVSRPGLVSRPDFMGLGLVSVSSLKGQGLVSISVSRFKGQGLARDYSIETTRPLEKTNEYRGMKKELCWR